MFLYPFFAYRRLDTLPPYRIPRLEPPVCQADAEEPVGQHADPLPAELLGALPSDEGGASFFRGLLNALFLSAVAWGIVGLAVWMVW